MIRNCTLAGVLVCFLCIVCLVVKGDKGPSLRITTHPHHPTRQSSTIRKIAESACVKNKISLTISSPFFYWSKSDFNAQSASAFFGSKCLTEIATRSTSIDYNQIKDSVFGSSQSDSVQFFLVDDYSLFRLWNESLFQQQQNQFQLIAQITKRHDLLLLSKKEKGITSFSDLRNRTVAVCQQHIPYFLSELTKIGLNQNDLYGLTVVKYADMPNTILDDGIDAYFVDDKYIFTGIRKTLTSLYYPREFNIVETSLNNATLFRYGYIVKTNLNMDPIQFQSIVSRFLMANVEMYVYCRENPYQCFEKWVEYDYMIDTMNALVWPSHSGFGSINRTELAITMSLFSNVGYSFKGFTEQVVNETYIDSVIPCYTNVGFLDVLCTVNATQYNVTGLEFQAHTPTFCEDFVFPYPLSCDRTYLYYRLYCTMVPLLIGALFNLLCMLLIPCMGNELLIKTRFIAPYITSISFTGFLIVSSIVFCKFTTFTENVAYGVASGLALISIWTYSMNLMRYFYIRNLFKIMKKSKRGLSSISLDSIRVHRIISSKPVFIIVWIVIIVLVAPAFFIAQYYAPENYIIKNGILLVLYAFATIGMILCFIADGLANRKTMKKHGLFSFIVFHDPLLYRAELLLGSLELLAIIWVSLSDHYVYNMVSFIVQGVGWLLLSVFGGLTWSYGFITFVACYRKIKRWFHRKKEILHDSSKDQFEKMLDNEDFYALLESYSKKELSSENLFLLSLLRKYRKKRGIMPSDLLFIYNNYVKNYAPYEVNISSNTKKTIRELLETNDMVLVSSASAKELADKVKKIPELSFNMFNSETNNIDSSYSTPYHTFVDSPRRTDSNLSMGQLDLPSPSNPSKFPSMRKLGFRMTSGNSEESTDEDMERATTEKMISFDALEDLYSEIFQNVIDTYSRLCNTQEYTQWESINKIADQNY